VTNSRRRENSSLAGDYQTTLKLAARVAGIATLAASFMPCTSAAESANLYLGIVEPPMVHYVGEKHKTPYVVRVVFQCKEGKWSAAPTSQSPNAEISGWLKGMPKQIRWTVGIDGKKRGNFTSNSLENKSDVGDRVHILQPDPGGQVPLIKEGTKKFQYWEDTAFRPVICTSGSDVDDPDAWKPEPSASARPPHWNELLLAFTRLIQATPRSRTIKS
jgi:hypothetical protein